MMTKLQRIKAAFEKPKPWYVRFYRYCGKVITVGSDDLVWDAIRSKEADKRMVDLLLAIRSKAKQS